MIARHFMATLTPEDKKRYLGIFKRVLSSEPNSDQETAIRDAIYKSVDECVDAVSPDAPSEKKTAIKTAIKTQALKSIASSDAITKFQTKSTAMPKAISDNCEAIAAAATLAYLCSYSTYNGADLGVVNELYRALLPKVSKKDSIQFDSFADLVNDDLSSAWVTPQTVGFFADKIKSINGKITETALSGDEEPTEEVAPTEVPTESKAEPVAEPTKPKETVETVPTEVAPTVETIPEKSEEPVKETAPSEVPTESKVEPAVEQPITNDTVETVPTKVEQPAEQSQATVDPEAAPSPTEPKAAEEPTPVETKAEPVEIIQQGGDLEPEKDTSAETEIIGNLKNPDEEDDKSEANLVQASVPAPAPAQNLDPAPAQSQEPVPATAIDSNPIPDELKRNEEPEEKPEPKKPRQPIHFKLPEGFGKPSNAAVWNTPVITDFGYPFLNFSSEAIQHLFKTKDMEDKKRTFKNIKKMLKEAKKRYGGIWKAIYGAPLELFKKFASDPGTLCVPNYLKVEADILDKDSDMVSVAPIKYFSVDPAYQSNVEVPRAFLENFYDVLDYTKAFKTYVKYSDGLTMQEFYDEICDNDGKSPFYLLVPKQARFSRTDVSTGSLFSALFGGTRCIMLKTIFKGKRGCFLIDKTSAKNLYSDIN